MAECYDWYIPPPRKVEVIKVGDKVEVIKPWSVDEELGIKIRDVAKVGDKVRAIGHPWDGYVGKVILVSFDSLGEYRGARITNPNFKEHGNHSNWWWFSKGRLEKIE